MNSINSSDATQLRFTIHRANDAHFQYAETICAIIEESAKQRGTGIAKRHPDYVISKMHEGKAVIALTHDLRFAGFCYIETWEDRKYVANSGLIVAPEFRKMHLAKRIKQAVFDLSREKFPDAKIFGITTSAAVLKINSDLGYRAAHFTELTTDDAFWKGCESCNNFDILQRTSRSMCLCTGMLYDPAEENRQASENIQIVSITMPEISNTDARAAQPQSVVNGVNGVNGVQAEHEVHNNHETRLSVARDASMNAASTEQTTEVQS